MRKVNRKKLSKFWYKLSKMGRSSSELYQGRCEKQVFVSRVSRLLFKEPTALKILFSDSDDYDYILTYPELNVTAHSMQDKEKRKYKVYSLDFVLGFGEELSLTFLDHQGNKKNKKLLYNDILGIMFQKITFGHYNNIIKKFLVPLSVRFERKHMRYKSGLKGSEHAKFISKVKIKDTRGLVEIRDYLDSLYNFKLNEKVGFDLDDDYWMIDVKSMTEEERDELINRPMGEHSYLNNVYTLVKELL